MGATRSESKDDSGNVTQVNYTDPPRDSDGAVEPRHYGPTANGLESIDIAHEDGHTENYSPDKGHRRS